MARAMSLCYLQVCSGFICLSKIGGKVSCDYVPSMYMYMYEADYLTMLSILQEL